jgi:hypothetical protein
MKSWTNPSLYKIGVRMMGGLRDHPFLGDGFLCVWPVIEFANN